MRSLFLEAITDVSAKRTCDWHAYEAPHQSPHELWLILHATAQQELTPSEAACQDVRECLQPGQHFRQQDAGAASLQDTTGHSGLIWWT